MPLSSVSMVSFDVDGTIFRKPALTRASRSLGIGEKWDSLDEMHLHRRITKREVLVSQYKLLQGMKLTDILQAVSKVEVIKNVRETVEKLQGHRIRVVLLTDNPDFLCAYLIERFGFEGYVGSKVGVKDGIVTGEIEPLPDKRLGLRKYCAWTGIPLSRCAHVGDWINDVPVFRIVRYSVALNAQTEKVKASASYHIETDDLLDVYKHLQSLV
ncbi:MAG TPA: HAD-IB family phosphatase [Candidatus Sulfotelmatobacter sp.]|nr:HAD-IB family phosphatase [Candidatus Sulfotelmatobacter sp.]